MATDREVAGIRCLEVLEVLGDYVDGELDAAARTQVDAHLRGCDWCERFGGRYAETVKALRAGLTEGAPEGVRARLVAKLG